MRTRGRLEKREVLRGVSFGVDDGEIFGLLGANGAGKTTLLKMLATLMVPTHGSILVCGFDTSRASLAARRCIGYVPADDRSFYYRMTARQNLAFFGAMAGVPRQALPRRIAEAAAVVTLTNDLDRKYAMFSTGMRQRLSIARALLNDPPLLLLDEPSRGVDPVAAHGIRKTLADLTASGKTVIISTNLLEEAWSTCHRVAVLREGFIAALDKPRNLRKRIIDRAAYYIRVDRPDGALLARVQEAPGVHSAEAVDEYRPALRVVLKERSAMNGLLQAISCNGVSVERVEPLDPQPSEIFAQLVEHA